MAGLPHSHRVSFRDKNERKRPWDIRTQTKRMMLRLLKMERRRKWSRKELRLQAVFDYLIKHPCVDCGETNVLVLQFDHVRGVKKFEISKAAKGKKLIKLEEEMMKCDVRCANCHQMKSLNENGCWKFKFLEKMLSKSKQETL